MAIATQTELLLRIWETQTTAHPIRRALALLAAVWPERSAEDWARVSLGERDSYLLALRERWFGESLQTTADCPRCGERLESNFTTSDIRVPLPSDTECLQWREAGYEVQFRAPRSEDLLAVCGTRAEDAARQLLQRCILTVRSGTEMSRELPPQLAPILMQQMAQADPGAEIAIALSCPACDHAFTRVFDIIGYLWGELDDWAQALLTDVLLLARSLGWSERDILALSPARRRFYLDLVQR